MLKQALNKGISTPIAISIVLILVILVGGFTWWQYGEMWREASELPEIELPEKEEVENKIADWETYTNEEYGFEMRYPKTWDFIQEPLSFIFLSRRVEDDATEFNCSLTIYTWEKEAISGYRNLLISSGEWEKSETKLNDYPVTKLVKKESLISTLYFLEGKQSFMIEYDINKYIINKANQRVVHGSIYNQECINLFNQMLSTFRFIEVQTIEVKANFIYLTEGEYSGNLGGRLGADEKCISPPELNCKPETVHAFITVDKDDSIINMAERYKLDKNLPIHWFNRTSKKAKGLANNWSEMISSGDFGLSLEGTELVGQNFAWTGGRGAGGNLATCNQWTTDEGDYQSGAGPQGIFGGGDSLFSASGWAGISHSRLCYNKHNLLCICEGNYYSTSY